MVFGRAVEGGSVDRRRLQARTSKLSLIAGKGLVALAALVLLGWVSGLYVLTQVLPGWPSMKVNTALGFALCGGALLALTRAEESWTGIKGVWACGAAASLLALWSLAAYAGVPLPDIDQILVADPFSTVAPGRMSEATAFCFLMAGVAALAFHRDGRAAALVRDGAILVGGLCAVFGLIAYLLEPPALWGVGFFSTMAVHTALGFVVAFTALAIDASLRGGLFGPCADSGPGGFIARRLLAGAVAVPVVVGWGVHLAVAEDILNPGLGFTFITVTSGLVLSALVLGLSHALSRAEAARVRFLEEALAARQSATDADVARVHLLNELGSDVRQGLSGIMDVCDQMRRPEVWASIDGVANAAESVRNRAVWLLQRVEGLSVLAEARERPDDPEPVAVDLAVVARKRLLALEPVVRAAGQKLDIVVERGPVMALCDPPTTEQVIALMLDMVIKVAAEGSRLKAIIRIEGYSAVVRLSTPRGGRLMAGAVPADGWTGGEGEDGTGVVLARALARRQGGHLHVGVSKRAGYVVELRLLADLLGAP
jgi:hypothetical protein